MAKMIHRVLQIVAVGGAIAGLEYYFFRSPDLTASRAQAAVRGGEGSGAAKGAQVAGAAAQGNASAAAERHLRNIKQLTFGGENAEAYWSFDGTRLTLQSKRDDLKADQIFTMNADGSGVKMVSTGRGRTTCSYFTKDGDRVLYASTHLGGDEPPPNPDFSQGYVWPIFDTYDIFTVKTDGTDLRRLTHAPGYDAEGTVSPDGKQVVFTSTRDGDLDLYTMDVDGRNVKRLTDAVGYDGGAFFSPDGKMICYRAYHPKTDAELKDYKDLLAKGLVRPSIMELYVMDADGSNKRQVTSYGAASFCPFFTPDGKKLIFSSNLENPKGRNFDLFLINLDGSGLEKVTTDPSFDGFPMFSPDGKKLVWASNRNARTRGETNVFVADWVW